ncbi:MAG: sensor histidine kinase [Nocardioides sp.]|nr:sensor histidine kinase [Nocardioides sp.]
MTDHPVPAGRRARPGWAGLAFAAVWLFYLADPFEAAVKVRDQPAGWTGMLAIGAFATVYLVSFQLVQMRRLMLAAGAPRALAATFLAAEAGLAVLICVLVGQPGTATVVYIAVMSVFFLPLRWGIVAAVLSAATAYAAGFVVAGWTEERGLLFGALAATLAVWGIRNVIQRNADLLEAREENARLAVAEERNRFARDLHDILGHSLTVITVKAELAQRLVDVDLDRTRAELADLERLSRDALADVRRAVDGYRELTLPGELARARIALESAGIDHQLPNSTDEVPGDLRELFAWTVREGVTNVVRHSAARECRVTMASDAVEVIDDGRGLLDGSVPGNGIRGLGERAAAMGASVITNVPPDGGYSLRVVVR